MPAGEFAVVTWDYGNGGDKPAIDAALRQAVPDLLLEFTCCLTAPANENQFIAITHRLNDICGQHLSFSFAAIWVDETVRNVFHQAGK
jgi:hypothetical protein